MIFGARCVSGLEVCYLVWVEATRQRQLLCYLARVGPMISPIEIKSKCRSLYVIKTIKNQPQAANWRVMTNHFPCPAIIDAGWNSTQHHHLRVIMITHDLAPIWHQYICHHEDVSRLEHFGGASEEAIKFIRLCHVPVKKKALKKPSLPYMNNSLQWRHNGCVCISNHQPHDCLLKRLMSRRSQITSKLRVTGLCEGNSPVAGVFPHNGPVTQKMLAFDDVIMYSKKYDLQFMDEG